MEWHILNDDGDRIASFVHEPDRDVALQAFQDYYSDCEFSTEDAVVAEDGSIS